LESGDTALAITHIIFFQFWTTEGRFRSLQLSQEEIEKYQAAIRFFRYYDKDGSGCLDKEEFR
jgi:hypothetical protein